MKANIFKTLFASLRRIKAGSSRDKFSEWVSVKAPADHFLKRLPGYVYSSSHAERIDLAISHPAIKGGARNMTARSSAEDAPSVGRREHRRRSLDFVARERLPGSKNPSLHLCIHLHASTPQMEVDRLQEKRCFAARVQPACGNLSRMKTPLERPPRKDLQGKGRAVSVCNCGASAYAVDGTAFSG